MKATTESEMIDVIAQKFYGLRNLQPSLLTGERFNDQRYSRTSQVTGKRGGLERVKKWSDLHGNMQQDRQHEGLFGIILDAKKEDTMRINLEVVERFHEKWVQKNGCWEWIAACAGKGYGQMKIPGTRKQIYAHRLSYNIHYGEIPNNMFVCHSCDNVKCVKPSHLFLGSCKDNLQDMKKKCRNLYGEKNTQSILSADKVRQIHALSCHGISQSKIAKNFGIAQSTVFKILKGYRWAHIFHEIYPDAD